MIRRLRDLTRWSLALPVGATIAAGLGACGDADTTATKPAAKFVWTGVLTALPEGWKSDCVIDELEPAKAERAVAEVGKVLASLPEAVSGRIGLVYLVEAMTFGMDPLAGTYFESNLLIDAHKNLLLSHTIFHETTTVLLMDESIERDKALRFSLGRFHLLNKRGFRYDQETNVEVPQGSTHTDPSLHAEGFINGYSKTSVYNDVSEIAGRLLDGDPDIWRAIETPGNKILRTKAEMVIDFFTGLDPTMNHAWFKARVGRDWLQ